MLWAIRRMKAAVMPEISDGHSCCCLARARENTDFMVIRYHSRQPFSPLPYNVSESSIQNAAGRWLRTPLTAAETAGNHPTEREAWCDRRTTWMLHSYRRPALRVRLHGGLQFGLVETSRYVQRGRTLCLPNVCSSRVVVYKHSIPY